MPDIVVNELYKEIDRLRARVKELEAERDAAVKWLEEYKSKTYCAYCGAIFNIDSDASHVSEHIRTCPHHPMRELEAENDELDRIAVTMCRQKNELEAENRRLWELVDGAREVVEISNFTFPAQREWKAAWLKKAAKAMKEASREGR
jgi:3-methyladenine DNA glycosylase/8-oxoguanine DNA glycosylase